MRGCENQGKVDVLSLVGTEVLAYSQALCVANHFIDSSETKLCHDSSQLVRNVIKEVDDVLWCSLELLAELRVLGSDTNGTGIQMTLLTIAISVNSCR